MFSDDREMPCGEKMTESVSGCDVLQDPVLAVVAIDADEALKCANLDAWVEIGDADGESKLVGDVVVLRGERVVASGANISAVAQTVGE